MSNAIQQELIRSHWLEERKKAIGASDVAAILGVSPYSSAWDVWAIKTGRVDSWQGNEATKLGQLFEAPILDYAESQLGQLRRNVRIVHDTLPVAATLDAQCVDTNRPVEAKTTGLVGVVNPHFGEPGTDEVPDTYLVQVYAQLLCSKADLGYLYALIPGKGVVYYEIQRNDAVIDKLGNVLDAWWQKHIIGGEEPSREKASFEIVKRMRREASKEIELGETESELLSRIESARKKKSEAGKELVVAESQLLAAMGDAEIARFVDGRSVSYLQQTRKSYVVEESKFRVLRVRKAK